MSSTPRLALCVPARNAAGHLPRLLASVASQTRPFDELLVFDDASTDATAAIARDSGATVASSGVNVGPSTGKNLLAGRVTAEWIHFHDADEALKPEFVERAHSWLERSDVDVILFGTEDRDDTTGTWLAERQWDDDHLQRDPVGYCIRNTVTNCGVYRRSAFLAAGGFDTRDDTKYNEDQAMHLRLAIAGLRFRADAYVGDVVYRRSGSMSSGHPIECARAHYHVLRDVADRTGRRHARDLAAELWTQAAVCGTYRDWEYSRKCLDLAAALGFGAPPQEHALIRFASRISPVGAVMAREAFIRVFKPRLRRHVPALR